MKSTINQRTSQTVGIYLPKELGQQAKNRELTFFNKLSSVLTAAGFDVRYFTNSLAERAAAKQRQGYSISLMKEPINARGLTIRRNYFYPFWNIQTGAKRWDWPVAKARFDPTTVTPQEAAVFANYWRKALFNEAARTVTREGFVYAPLQGRLREHRSFQFCSPLEMLREVLEYDTTRPVIATLHPKETYSHSDIAALEKISQKHPRLTIRNRDMTELLKTCDYVATQNSSAALFGYFFHKPAVLFGQIDFHHIAAKVDLSGAEAAILSAPNLAPDYDAYLCWFFKHMSINAELPTAEAKITDALKRAGWPL